MRHRNLIRVLAIVVIVIVVAVLAVVLARQLRDRSSGGGISSGKTVEELLGLGQEAAPVYYKGKEYRLNPDLDSYLFIGVDRSESREENGYEELYGVRADELLLMVLDRTQERVTVLQLNRDTIVFMDEIDKDGNFVRTRRTPILYSYYFGDGTKASCENVVKTVSKLLYGMEIDGYAALSMEAIVPLNDLIGGVTVTIEDDFSAADPALVKGETVTLLGEHAWHYVHDRINVGDNTNLGRMQRHRTYYFALADQMKAKTAEDAGFAARLYQAAMPYMQTNMGSKTVVNLLDEASCLENAGIVTLTGRNETDEYKDVHFYVDEDNLRETVLGLFYLEVEK